MALWPEPQKVFAILSLISYLQTRVDELERLDKLEDEDYFQQSRVTGNEQPPPGVLQDDFDNMAEDVRGLSYYLSEKLVPLVENHPQLSDIIVSVGVVFYLMNDLFQ